MLFRSLLARRLAERGVRFIQLYHRGWDHHLNLPSEIAKTAKAVDQPSAALITTMVILRKVYHLEEYLRPIHFNNLGILLKNTDREAAAEECYAEAADIHKKLADDFPAVSAHQNEAAGARTNMGRLLLIRKDFAYWDDIAVHYRNTVVTSTGHGFCGIERKRLLNLFQARAAELGVKQIFSHEFHTEDDFPDADLIVAVPTPEVLELLVGERLDRRRVERPLSVSERTRHGVLRDDRLPAPRRCSDEDRATAVEGVERPEDLGPIFAPLADLGLKSVPRIVRLLGQLKIGRAHV